MADQCTLINADKGPPHSETHEGDYMNDSQQTTGNIRNWLMYPVKLKKLRYSHTIQQQIGHLPDAK